MDFEKINKRWVYGLTLSVFARNLVTYLIIAFISAVFGFAQAFFPFIGLFTLPATIYFGVVSFMIVHKTILTDDVITPGDAFALTPELKTYFWQYVFLFGIPVLVAILGLIFIYVAREREFDLDLALWAVAVVSALFYFLIMALFGTSLPATALKADGMMMLSRGKATFFYSLFRLILLPLLPVAAVFGGIYLLLANTSDADLAAAFEWLLNMEALPFSSLLLFYTGLQLLLILVNIITAVILTKAFLLAEVRLALQGEVTNWARRNFGIEAKQRGVIYK